MKKLSFLLSIATALLFTQCAKNEITLDPIPPTPYSKPLIVETIHPNGNLLGRNIYTYNSKDLETGIKGSSFERTNYKYEGKRSSYTDISYSFSGSIMYQAECVQTFWDTKYTRPLSIDNVVTYYDGTREREVYTYNSDGLEASYKKYVNGILDSDRINYKYEGMKSSYTQVSYTKNGEKISLINTTTTFEDTKYKRPLVIENVYSSPYDDQYYSRRTVFTYNAQGLVTSRKSYTGDNLIGENKDYTYGDKKSSYIQVIDGSLGDKTDIKVNTTYLY